MNLKHFSMTMLACMVLSMSQAQAKDYTITSPDGQLQVTIHADSERLTWEIQHGKTQVLMPSEIGLNGTSGYYKPKGRATTNSITLGKGLTQVEFRADNDAAAYRIKLSGKGSRVITDEKAEFNFAGDYQAFIPYVNDNRGGERYCFSFESYYDEQPLSKMFRDSLAINPLAVRLPDGKLAVIADMGAIDYPGMFLVKHGDHGLKAIFAPYPSNEEIGGYDRLNLVPTERAPYIARDVRGALPWRIVMVTTEDKQLLTARLPQRFGPPCQIADTSWIRPGKVAWDWWNATMLTGVPFRAGMNTDTYRYYIDFAAANRLEYIIIDEALERQGVLARRTEPRHRPANPPGLRQAEGGGHHPVVVVAQCHQEYRGRLQALCRHGSQGFQGRLLRPRRPGGHAFSMGTGGMCRPAPSVARPARLSSHGHPGSLAQHRQLRGCQGLGELQVGAACE